jgi:RimJ/RimL family protein N-acetyltransferase
MLRYITPEQVKPEFAALFDPQTPASLRICLVLSGLEPGKIITDDPVNPTWGAAWEAGDGTLYPGGALDQPVVNEVVADLRKSGDVLVGFWGDEAWLSLLPPNPQYDGWTLEYMDRPDDTEDLQALVDRMPTGYQLRRADSELLKRALWYDDTVRRHGSVEAFLEKGLCICLLEGDTIASEAYAGPRVRGTRELGVITREEYRGRGLATLTSAALILACTALGDKTYWNCAESNVASAGVARNLAYRTEKKYHLLAWSRAER